MAAPTSVRVEAQSMTTTVLRWDYAGANAVSVYRSTDGSSYSSVEVVASSTTEYTDEDLDSGTKYWYKLTDDAGLTFSDVVTVYTHFCADQNAGKAFQLPRFDEGQQDQSASLNDLAERVERAIGDAVLAPETCYVCPDAGAVVIDCTDGCTSFFVVADQDINSFTINRCGNNDPRINIYVPPGETRQICGFPPGYGFGGDECTEAPISGGTKGKTMALGGGGAAGGGGGGGGRSTPGKPKTGKASGSGGGGGGGGGGCECVPGRNNELTLKCCTAECSLSCATSRSLTIKVCGGVGPYTFEHTGSVKLKRGVTGDEEDEITTDRRDATPQVNVVPPTNSGSAVAGTAYYTYWKYKCSNIGSCSTCYHGMGFGCDDVLDTVDSGLCHPTRTCAGGDLSNCSQLSCKACPSPEGAIFCNGSGSQCEGPCQGANATCQICTNSVWTGHSGDFLCDVRTAGMISNGCSPCGVQQGSVVTVTDSAGVSVSITLQR